MRIPTLSQRTRKDGAPRHPTSLFRSFLPSLRDLVPFSSTYPGLTSGAILFRRFAAGAATILSARTNPAFVLDHRAFFGAFRASRFI